MGQWERCQTESCCSRQLYRQCFLTQDNRSWRRFRTLPEATYPEPPAVPQSFQLSHRLVPRRHIQIRKPYRQIPRTACRASRSIDDGLRREIATGRRCSSRRIGRDRSDPGRAASRTTRCTPTGTGCLVAEVARSRTGVRLRSVTSVAVGADDSHTFDASIGVVSNCLCGGDSVSSVIPGTDFGSCLVDAGNSSTLRAVSVLRGGGRPGQGEVYGPTFTRWPLGCMFGPGVIMGMLLVLFPIIEETIELISSGLPSGVSVAKGPASVVVPASLSSETPMTILCRMALSVPTLGTVLLPATFMKQLCIEVVVSRRASADALCKAAVVKGAIEGVLINVGVAEDEVVETLSAYQVANCEDWASEGLDPEAEAVPRGKDPAVPFTEVVTVVVTGPATRVVVSVVVVLAKPEMVVTALTNEALMSSLSESGTSDACLRNIAMKLTSDFCASTESNGRCDGRSGSAAVYYFDAAAADDGNDTSKSGRLNTKCADGLRRPCAVRHGVSLPCRSVQSWSCGVEQKHSVAAERIALANDASTLALQEFILSWII
ncbi:hypothetical protein KC339_g27 [Hortaea werneckii]|nr:hypothetical protein KC339_g27 [Hortaea werneckii]